MSKDLNLVDLKLFLKEIIISNSIFNSGIHSFDDEQNMKNGGWINYTNIIFNKYSYNEFFKNLEVFKSKLFEEIDFNREVENKSNFENYLYEIIETISTCLNNFNQDKDSNNFNCTILKHSNQLKDFKLDKTYLDEIEKFKRTLLDEIYSLQNRLIQIPEYKNIHTKSQKSLTGNKKIIWKKQLNQLVDFYLSQIEMGYIETDRDNLRDFIINNFTHKGETISENTINTYLDPNKEHEKLPKGNKKIDPSDFLREQ